MIRKIAVMQLLIICSMVSPMFVGDRKVCHTAVTFYKKDKSLLQVKESHSAVDYLRFLDAVKVSSDTKVRNILDTTFDHLGKDYEDAKAIATENCYTKKVPLGIILGMNSKTTSMTKKLNNHFAMGNTKFETTKEGFNVIADIAPEIRERYRNNRKFFKAIVNPTVADKCWYVAECAMVGGLFGGFTGAAAAYGVQYGQNFLQATQEAAELKHIELQKAQVIACIDEIKSAYDKDLDNSAKALGDRQDEYGQAIALSIAGAESEFGTYQAVANIRQEPLGEEFFAPDPVLAVHDRAFASSLIAGAGTTLVAAGSVVIPSVIVEPVTLHDIQTGAGLGAFAGGTGGLVFGLTTKNRPLRDKSISRIKPSDKF